MSADATQPERTRPLDLTPAPDIREVTIRRRRFDPPYATWVGTRKREFREGVAITLVTPTELPVRALNPTLRVGDVILDRIRKTNDGYEFLALDEDLEEGAPILFQWPDGDPVETNSAYQAPGYDGNRGN